MAEHDFAAVFALIKKYGGLSQSRIASACHLTPGKVSTIISGRQQVTGFEVVCRISDGLRVPGHLLGLAPRAWETRPMQKDPSPPESKGERPSTDEVPWRPDATVDLAANLTRSDLVMARRAATRALAGAAITGAALLGPLEGWLQPAAPPAVHVAAIGSGHGGRGVGVHCSRVPGLGPQVRWRSAPQGRAGPAQRGRRPRTPGAAG
ncbi:helix-turn-helix domain-containing protein [Streptomyces sp. S1D4-11]